MQDLSPIDKAIAAHARWKSHLRQAIETGKSESTVATVRLDNACEFGKWLLQCSGPQRMTEHFKTVRDLHARFHIEASHVLELALTGRRAEAEAAMANASPFANVSSRLTIAMTAWKKAMGPAQPR